MSSLRIAVYHDLPSGGAKRALQRQVAGLVSLSHQVEVFVPSTAEEDYLPLEGLATSVTRIDRPRPPDRERALEGGPSPVQALHWIRFLRTVYRSERAIARQIDTRGYDLVLVAASQFTQAPWVLRWLNTTSLYYCQEPLRAAYEPRISGPAVRLGIRQTLGRIDRRNARAASHIAVNSHFSALQIERIYGRRVEVNYLGVDADQFRPLKVEERDFVLTVAALHPLKGLDFLVRSLATIDRAERPPLLIVSDRSRGAERDRLEKLGAELGVELRFRFRVAEEELVLLYNRARLVVYAPHNEPFGFVPLEAMACGRPVLAVREGGIPETTIEGVTGFLCDRDPLRFGSRVRELLADSPRATAVGEGAAAIVRHQWSWDHSVRELARICVEVVNRNERSHSKAT